MPPAGDAVQYAKLIQIPYRSEWLRLGNVGDHIGATMRPFARRIIAPLLVTGQIPELFPATQPSATTAPARAAQPAEPATTK